MRTRYDLKSIHAAAVAIGISITPVSAFAGESPQVAAQTQMADNDKCFLPIQLTPVPTRY
jgi:hypothetical protein